MSIATIEVQPRAMKVGFIDDKLSVSIEDGRVVLVPQAWYPRLLYATESEQHALISEDAALDEGQRTSCSPPRRQTGHQSWS